VWDLRSSEELRVVRLGSKIQSLALHPERDWLAVGCMDHKVRLYDVAQADSMPAATVLEPPHYDQVTCLAFARRTLFSGSRDFTIKRWETDKDGATWRNTHTQSNAHGTGAQVTCLSSLSADLDTLSCMVSGSARGSLKIWDPTTSEPLGEVLEHSGAINDLAVCGTTLYSASSDRTVKVWQYAEPTHITHRRHSIIRRQQERTERQLSTQDQDGIFGLPTSMDTPDVEFDDFLANAPGSPEQNPFMESLTEEDTTEGGALNNTFTLPAASPPQSAGAAAKAKPLLKSPQLRRAGAGSRIPVTPTRPSSDKKVVSSPRIDFSV